MLFITQRLQAYFLNIWQMAFVYINALLQACLELPYMRLRRSSSVAITSSTMACLSSWIVMIRLRNTRSFRNRHRKKSGTVSWGDRADQAVSSKLRTQVTRYCTFERSIATDHMKWRPLLYRSPSRQPQRAIAPAQYSNLKCVSRLRATLYIVSVLARKNAKSLRMLMFLYIATEYNVLWWCIVMSNVCIPSLLSPID